MPYFGTMLNEKAGQEVEILDLQFGFAPGEVHGHLSSYGESGRSFFLLLELTLDVVYPIIYTLFLGIAMFMMYRIGSSGRPIRNLHRLPLLVILFDYLENLSIVALLSVYPSDFHWMAVLCSTFTLLKWLSFGLVLVTILYGLLWRLVKLLRPA